MEYWDCISVALLELAGLHASYDGFDSRNDPYGHKCL